MQVYENEILGFFFAPLGAEKVEIARQLGAEPTGNLREALAEALLDAEEASPGLVESSVVSMDLPTPLKSILFKLGRSHDSRQLVAFSFSDAFKDSALPLLGIFLAVFAGTVSLATVPAALGVAKTLWQRLVILRAPQDADAIHLLEALGCAGAANLADRRTIAPTWEQTVAQSGLDPKQASLALRSLRSKAIIEIESWGGQREDLDHLANRWKVRF
jgi:hypothetical protein